MEKKEKLNASAFKNHSSSLEKQKNSVSEINKTTNQTNSAVKTSSNTEGKDLQKIRDLILSKKSPSNSAKNEKADQSKLNPLI